jgi:hypothetical protein
MFNKAKLEAAKTRNDIRRLEVSTKKLIDTANNAKHAVRELHYALYGPAGNSETVLCAWGSGLVSAVNALSTGQNEIRRNQDLILEHLGLQVVDLQEERILAPRED